MQRYHEISKYQQQKCQPKGDTFLSFLFRCLIMYKFHVSFGSCIGPNAATRADHLHALLACSVGAHYLTNSFPTNAIKTGTQDWNPLSCCTTSHPFNHIESHRITLDPHVFPWGSTAYSWSSPPYSPHFSRAHHHINPPLFRSFTVWTEHKKKNDDRRRAPRQGPPAGPRLGQTGAVTALFEDLILELRADIWRIRIIWTIGI